MTVEARREHAQPDLLWLAALPLALFALLVWGLGTYALPWRFDAAWVPSLDIALAFRIDGLSALMLALIFGVGTWVFVYASGYLAHAPGRGRLLAVLTLFMLAMAGAVAQGARSVTGTTVDLKRVPETVPADVFKSAGGKADQAAAIAEPIAVETTPSMPFAPRLACGSMDRSVRGSHPSRSRTGIEFPAHRIAPRRLPARNTPGRTANGAPSNGSSSAASQPVIARSAASSAARQAASQAGSRGSPRAPSGRP